MNSIFFEVRLILDQCFFVRTNKIASQRYNSKGLYFKSTWVWWHGIIHETINFSLLSNSKVSDNMTGMQYSFYQRRISAKIMVRKEMDSARRRHFIAFIGPCCWELTVPSPQRPSAAVSKSLHRLYQVPQKWLFMQ